MGLKIGNKFNTIIAIDVGFDILRVPFATK